MSATVRHSSLGVPGSKRGAATVYVREREFANEEDFNQWFKDEKVNWRKVPEEDDDKSFVCAFASSIIDQKQVFCLTWFTQKLRRMQHLSKVIQVDATYKLNWHGFPVMVCGFSDAEQHFFATHLALVSNVNTWCYERFFEAISALNYIPEIIMGDGDTTISAAAKNVWMLIKRAMCYAHVKMNLKEEVAAKSYGPCP
uniref:MULE transposase domain-containing protein n=1 Tax=Ditylenchus dipsaci TaxID=166011 RepID=A0A915DY44_9BILA